MKLLSGSYLIAALAAVLLVTGCASLSGGEAARTEAANRIIQAYDVPELLAQAAPAVMKSLDNNLPDDVGSDDRQRLDRIVKDAYTPLALRQDVVQRLSTQAVEAGHESALGKAADALESPLAQRMIGLEGSVSDQDFAQGFNSFIDKPASDARKKRLKVIDALAGDMQVVDLQTNFNLTLLESMIRARNAVVDSSQQVDEPQVKRMLSNTRAEIHGKLEQQVPLMLLYVYRDVNEATLQQYADLQSRPALDWVNSALERAITQSLASAGDPIPDRYEEGS